MAEREPKLFDETITPTQMRAFVDKIQEVVPLEDCHLDWRDAYVAHFETEMGRVSVYQPMVIDTYENPNDMGMSEDTYRVVEHRARGLKNGRVLVTARTYAVRERLDEATYSETVQVYDEVTKRRELSRRQPERPVFDNEKFEKVMELLDTVKSESDADER